MWCSNIESQQILSNRGQLRINLIELLRTVGTTYNPPSTHTRQRVQPPIDGEYHSLLL